MKKPLNVLVLMSDEHNPKFLGCADHPFIQTPNLDRLASRGTRFSQAYTCSPICVPARAAFATGRYVHEVGFWDNADAVHHLTEEKAEIANILDACIAAGNPDRAFIFASTSKITLAGAGLAFFASSPANLAWYMARAFKRTIGSDKLNQLRHVRFLKDQAGLMRHMDGHRALLAPKFAAVEAALARRLTGTGAATWVRPKGGYFISLVATPGTAKQVVALAKDAGLALTAAGSTWPHGKDPADSNLRLAPTFPTLADVTVASEGIALCILLAAIEKQAADRAAG